MSRTPKLSTPGELAALASMARNRAPGLSDVTLRVQTDLLMSGGRPGPEMAKSYEALLTALLPRIEARTVDIVLGKLANWPHLTPALIALIHDYRPALLSSVPMTGDDPIGSEADIALPDATLHPADDIDAGSDMTPARSTTQAANRTQADTIEAPADLAGLVERARGDKALARLLVSQPDLPALALAPLFADADVPAKARILAATRKHLSIAPIASPPRATTREIEQIIGLMCTQPAAAAAMIAGILMGGDRLAQALEADVDRTLTTLASVALGFEPEETIRLLLVAGDAVARSTQQITALVELARNVSADCALRLVAAISGEPLVRPAGAQAREHIPQAAPSGTPSRPVLPVVTRPARRVEWAIHLNKPQRPAG